MPLQNRLLRAAASAGHRRARTGQIGGHATAAPGSAHVTERNPFAFLVCRRIAGAALEGRRAERVRAHFFPGLLVTTVRIAHVEPWPGRRGLRGHGFRVFSFLVVLADDAGGRALPVWLNGPEGHGPRPPARIEFTAAGTAGPRQMTARIGYALALAAATGAPIQVAGQVMDQLAVPAHDDLLAQFTREVPVPRPKHHRFARMFRGHPRTA